MTIKYIEMKQKDIKPLKEKLWERNYRKCPVLAKEIPLDKMVLDHAHKRNDQEYSPTKGVIRESLDFRVNAVLGKLENALVRTGLANEEGFDIVQFLHNSADYFERGAYVETLENEDTYFVHPNEVPKEKKLMKSSYNKLKKIYDGKAKFPDYPKSGKITKGLERLFDKLSLIPEFYS